MDMTAPNRAIAASGKLRPPDTGPAATAALMPAPTPAGEVALAAAQALARQATAAATLRAYRADWTHFAD
jgi:hypothetical protein